MGNGGKRVWVLLAGECGVNGKRVGLMGRRVWDYRECRMSKPKRHYRRSVSQLEWTETTPAREQEAEVPHMLGHINMPSGFAGGLNLAGVQGPAGQLNLNHVQSATKAANHHLGPDYVMPPQQQQQYLQLALASAIAEQVLEMRTHFYSGLYIRTQPSIAAFVLGNDDGTGRARILPLRQGRTWRLSVSVGRGNAAGHNESCLQLRNAFNEKRFRGIMTTKEKMKLVKMVTGVQAWGERESWDLTVQEAERDLDEVPMRSWQRTRPRHNQKRRFQPQVHIVSSRHRSSRSFTVWTASMTNGSNNWIRKTPTPSWPSSLNAGSARTP
ncbi:uncharacterized protein EV422DRAFT_599641 [Fimicolochytrium jonesii]|uniref:uncharacterized protein n=1 Tax=Fimicolochytrium jonesii TaxID=1396493 RepID=UPI0022FF140B|nr:uncharacterized protein EV422DRAFT_599641 [Fimicolochytrium jonesii]KAI8819036.1 hypothetical protein EV422DRAFT_599641 [Fimicolochytrium jonesii]